ncbi:hypothetical protein FXF00_05435 [Vibrio cholerae]|nr:hypothetical protein FXF00_05435 [Vibrio cholerae]
MQKHVVKPNFLLRVVERLYQGGDSYRYPVVLQFCSASGVLHFTFSGQLCIILTQLSNRLGYGTVSISPTLPLYPTFIGDW